MANLVSDIIDESFMDLGVISPGESISAAQQADAFRRLVQMYALLSLEQLSVNTVKHQTLTLTAGTAAYTFGTAGTLVATATPVRVTAAASVSGNQRKSIKVISHEEFEATIDDPLGSRSIFAAVLAADNAYPNINLRVFPMPDTAPASLLLDYWSVLVAFAAVGDSLALAPGYENILHWLLAVELMGQYKPDQQRAEFVLAKAQAAKESLVALNRSILGQQQPAA